MKPNFSNTVTLFFKSIEDRNKVLLDITINFYKLKPRPEFYNNNKHTVEVIPEEAFIYLNHQGHHSARISDNNFICASNETFILPEVYREI